MCVYVYIHKHIHTYIYSFSFIFFHHVLSQKTGYISLCYTVGSHCLFVLNVIVCIFLKARWGRDAAGCCKLPGVRIPCSCSCPCRSGPHVPLNLQQDKCYFLFLNFLFLYEWKSVRPLKVRPLRMGSPVYFRLWATFLTGSKSNSNTKVKVKETDRIRSQIHSSLLQTPKMRPAFFAWSSLLGRPEF